MLGFSASNLSGAAINVATWGWPGYGLSHVGIVCERPATDGVHAGNLMLVESTCLVRSKCLYARRRICGVQAHHIMPRVGRYCGRVWRYELAKPFTAEESQHLTGYCLSHMGRRYDWLGAFKARDLALGLVRRIICSPAGDEAYHSLFCSELVAAGLSFIGRFRTLTPEHWSPNRLGRAAIDRGVYRPSPTRIK